MEKPGTKYTNIRHVFLGTNTQTIFFKVLTQKRNNKLNTNNTTNDTLTQQGKNKKRKKT